MSDFIVGLTGGIGSGKTAVSNRFQALGISVVDADIASRVVVEPGQPALEKIVDHFGEHLLTSDSVLDRKALRDEMTKHEDNRRWLEKLLHPLIGLYISDQLARATSVYAMLVVPLLVEGGRSKTVNRVLVVDTPEALQIQRTLARDDTDLEQIKAIMQAQATRDERLQAADDVIVNDQGLDHLDTEVAKLHHHYLVLAAQHSA